MNRYVNTMLIVNFVLQITFLLQNVLHVSCVIADLEYQLILVEWLRFWLQKMLHILLVKQLLQQVEWRLDCKY